MAKSTTFPTRMVLLATFAIFVVGSQNSRCAEIREDGPTALVLEGTIAAGDYEKVNSLIAGQEIDTIVLASLGGNLVEAMKIGRLVRQLKLYTTVPALEDDGLSDKESAEHHVHDKANRLCTSACFFVFVAGVWRNTWYSDELRGTSPPALGIHRPYLAPR